MRHPLKILWASIRSKPVIIITLAYGLVRFVGYGYNACRALMALGLARNGEIASVTYMHWFTSACFDSMLGALVVYGCIRRPTWGRAVLVFFAVWVNIESLLSLLLPDPRKTALLHASAALRTGYAEGIVVGTLLVLGYLGYVVFGRSAKAYFPLTETGVRAE
jgi:hypothetical protein